MTWEKISIHSLPKKKKASLNFEIKLCLMCCHMKEDSEAMIYDECNVELDRCLPPVAWESSPAFRLRPVYFPRWSNQTCWVWGGENDLGLVIDIAQLFSSNVLMREMWWHCDLMHSRNHSAVIVPGKLGAFENSVDGRL